PASTIQVTSAAAAGAARPATPSAAATATAAPTRPRTATWARPARRSLTDARPRMQPPDRGAPGPSRPRALATSVVTRRSRKDLVHDMGAMRATRSGQAAVTSGPWVIAWGGGALRAPRLRLGLVGSGPRRAGRRRRRGRADQPHAPSVHAG